MERTDIFAAALKLEHRVSSIRQDLLPQMHVLTLTPFYPTAADDASGCFIAESVGELQRKGVESSAIVVYPIYRAYPGPDSKAPPAVAKKYVCIPGNAGLSSAGNFLYAALKHEVRRLHSGRPISLIHAHAALPCGQAAMLLARDLGIPFVVTVHGLDVFSTRQVPGWLGRRRAAVCRNVYAAADRVICISERVAQGVRDRLEESANISVVYNGVDAALFAPGPGDYLPRPVILSVGNLIRIKGHELLLRAVAAIASSHPQLECRIIGDGLERARLQGLARELRVEDRIRFMGRRSRAEVAQAMRECTVFALPSSYEGLGCVYLEAMSAERPTIGCRGQGIDEVIRHAENGWLIQPKDLGELTSALQRLLADRNLRENIGRAGRRTILEGFTLAHQAERLVSIYGDCIA